MWGNDMSKIPNDIMLEATRIYTNDIPSYIDAGPELAEYFARAIFSERQACEKIARDRAEQNFEEGFRGFSSSRQIKAEEALKIADLIAKRPS
jgi:hypothetical protein